MSDPAYRPKTLTAGCVRAILDGRKSQLRQAITPQPPEGAFITGIDEQSCLTWLYGGQKYCSDPCPMGRPGDLLWVREPWKIPDNMDDDGDPAKLRREIRYEADESLDQHRGVDDAVALSRLPAKEMPRWASRLTLKVLLVRAERIQDINDEDVRAEGGMWRITGVETAPHHDRAGFARWWSEVNLKVENSWEHNPWVWVIQFRQAEEK